MYSKLRLAVALRYRYPEDAAPMVLASGRGLWADRMIEVAEQEGIPLHQDEVLAETLEPLPFGSTIPPELYSAVAQVLAMVMRMEGTLASSKSSPRPQNSREMTSPFDSQGLK